MDLSRTDCDCVAADSAQIRRDFSTWQVRRRTGRRRASLSKSALLNAIVEASGEAEVSRKQVKAVLDAIVALGHRELKKNGIFCGARLRQVPRREEARDEGCAKASTPSRSSR